MDVEKWSQLRRLAPLSVYRDIRLSSNAPVLSTGFRVLGYSIRISISQILSKLSRFRPLFIRIELVFEGIFSIQKIHIVFSLFPNRLGVNDGLVWQIWISLLCQTFESRRLQKILLRILSFCITQVKAGWVLITSILDMLKRSNQSIMLLS